MLIHGVVPMRAAPFGHGLEGPSKALLHRLDMDRELPSPAERALVRQAENVEGVRLCPRPDRSRQGCTPELYETRLFRMEGQSVPCEPLGKHLQDLLGVLPILKAEHAVIGVSDFKRFAAEARLHVALVCIAAHDWLDRLAWHYRYSLTQLVKELAASAEGAVEAKLPRRRARALPRRRL